jgi:hypothetical protein
MSEKNTASGTEALDPAQELEQAKIELRNNEATIHRLNVENARDRIKVARAHSDVETMTFWLEGAVKRAAYFKRRTLGGLFRRLLGPTTSAKPKENSGEMAFPPQSFRYFLRNSPYRIYREPTFTLEGWAVPENGAPVTALRARVDDQEFLGTYGVEESFVPEWHGLQANNPLPGFKIIVETPPGRHRLAIEAQLGDGKWHALFNIPIWSLGTGETSFDPLE